ncbi:MAG: hypothetical protein EPN91_08660 [Salinibacterium sp.]|nr:MAG: hypothetical protein EPN91_08660 [Salinibacterium sp.]
MSTEREKAAKQLEAYASAEERARQTKELLQAAGAHSHLIVETERLQLRIHYEVKRARMRVDELTPRTPVGTVDFVGVYPEVKKP